VCCNHFAGQGCEAELRSCTIDYQRGAMSEMDWETTGQPFPPHQNAGQARCPYVPPRDAAGNFQFPGLQSQSVNPNVSFHPAHPTPQGFWDSFSQQNMLPHEGMSNRFVPMNNGSHHPGRAPDIANFDYHMGLDGHSPPSGPSRHSRFEGNRPLPQRTRSYLGGHPVAETQAGLLVVSSDQSSSSGSVDLASNYNGGNVRRNVSGSAIPQENGSSNLPNSQNRHLPPPNSAYPGLFPQQNVTYPRQPRFSADLTVPNGVQSKYYWPIYVNPKLPICWPIWLYFMN
jgi:hypothetical protein